MACVGELIQWNLSAELLPHELPPGVITECNKHEATARDVLGGQSAMHGKAEKFYRARIITDE